MHIGPSLLLLAGTALTPSCSIGAQVDPPHARSNGAADLTATVAALDSALFAAFNAHDAEHLGTFFTKDLEFYHDKTGLAGYDSTLAGFQRLFTQPTTDDIRRELVPSSLKVHPLGEFGLLEICQHRFCHTENGHEECGTFKKIMIWCEEGDRYKVCRVISYDH
ncbi:MAG: nuclear transport factor 2 family protein [Flavobacteriales bacterium]|nr:nuclear transport factor 2 family protein [Flavobacteriales bacterium]